MFRKRVGLRTVKTGLAVSLSLLVAVLLGSENPIFAIVAAISAMSRTVNGTLESCREQLIGTAFGAFMGCLFLNLFPNHHFMFMGLGIIVVILFCNLMRVPIAIPLSCIVFCVICLNDPTESNVAYSFHRFMDTLTGLLVAFAVNALILPYNNLPQIQKIMRSLQKDMPLYARDKIIEYHIPDLIPLQHKLEVLDHELEIYEKEFFQRTKRKSDAAYLRGCQQLLVKMSEELFSICHLDSTPLPTAKNLNAMADMGLRLPNRPLPDGKCDTTDHIVLNFHLTNLIDCHRFLTMLMTAPDAPKTPPMPWAPLSRRLRIFHFRILRFCIRQDPSQKRKSTKPAPKNQEDSHQP